MPPSPIDTDGEVPHNEARPRDDLLPLAWLAPDITEAILEGRQPRGLTVKRLLAKLPMDWEEQRWVLGFDAQA